MLADFHSLTTVHDGKLLSGYKKSVLLDYFALLPDNLDNMCIFEQSKIEKLMNIVWILSSITPYSLILRSHTFKDSQSKNSDINMAVFNYSILMTADIITYDIDTVPV
jgi:tryptophanyl-tRNA synthetase